LYAHFSYLFLKYSDSSLSTSGELFRVWRERGWCGKELSRRFNAGIPKRGPGAASITHKLTISYSTVYTHAKYLEFVHGLRWSWESVWFPILVKSLHDHCVSPQPEVAVDMSPGSATCLLEAMVARH
jgi:hypothetical protein